MKSRGAKDPVELARRAAARAYAPYSGFRVGAVLEDREGRLHPGCNVECASISLSICAERAAMGLALSRGCGGFRALWIYTPTSSPTPPCGACRELLSRLAPGLTLVLLADDARPRRTSPDRLLPGAARKDARAS